MEYRAHLSKDKRLKKLVDQHDGMKLVKRRNIFLYLCRSIMSQQLSTRVADIIHKRFVSLYGGDPTPQQVLETPFETLRGIGLSNAKTRYVQHVARFAIDQGMEFKALAKMDDEGVIQYLTQIKGVGRWTAEMMLMFVLGREDVFSADDLGIQQAMAGIYRLDPADKKKFREDIIRISGKWSPYRTYACMHLWHWKDQKKKK